MIMGGVIALPDDPLDLALHDLYIQGGRRARGWV